jgi:hypothetical protein
MHYGAGAAGYSSRNRAALALIFGMHMLALFAWMQQRPARLPDVPRVLTFLLRPSMPPPTPRSSTPSAPPAPAYPSPRKPLPPTHDVFGGWDAPAPAKSAPPEAAATPLAPAPAASAATAAAPGLEDTRAPVTVQEALSEQKQADGGFGLGLSRRQAGRIDRELRKGKSGVPDEPDTPMGRFRRGLEAAHIERSTAVHEDSYTSPDGTVIYRKRIGKMVICRRSGNISPLGMRIMTMGSEAGDVPCPRGVDWQKD